MDLTSYLLGKKAGGGGSGGITPTGTLSITENGDYDVTRYANASVNVESSGGGTDTLGEFLRLRNGQYLFARASGINNTLYGDHIIAQFISLISPISADLTYTDYMFYEQSYITTVPLFDTSNVLSMTNMFAGCSMLKTVPLFNTSKVTTTRQMFHKCNVLSEVPLFDTSKVTDMYRMFGSCSLLETVPLFDTSRVTNMSELFSHCYKLISVPLFNTSRVTNMGSMFYEANALLSVPQFDVRGVTNFSSMFYANKVMTEIWIKNIKANLQVGSGTSWGHKLTVESLIHLIYELRDTGSSKTLTMGATNLAKLADVYVKTVDVTDEMRAEDDLIDEKLPFVVCDSTDEGAMLITEYVPLKNWALK